MNKLFCSLSNSCHIECMYTAHSKQQNLRAMLLCKVLFFGDGTIFPLVGCLSHLKCCIETLFSTVYQSSVNNVLEGVKKEKKTNEKAERGNRHCAARKDECYPFTPWNSPKLAGCAILSFLAHTSSLSSGTRRRGFIGWEIFFQWHVRFLSWTFIYLPLRFFFIFFSF